MQKIKQAFLYNEPLYLMYGIIKKLYTWRWTYYRLEYKALLRKLTKCAWKADVDKDSLKSVLKQAFGDFSDYAAFVDAKTKQAILKEANENLKHRFQILGYTIEAEEKIDWHIDYVSGFRWPKGTFFGKYVQVDLNNDADVKIPREISRAHYFLRIGEAYLLTGDERYTSEFVTQIEDWIEENPLMYSINWGCTQDVAIRIANWTYALNMFIDSPLITEEFLKKFFVSCYQHAWFISKNLERSYRWNANHFDGDIVGFLFVSLLFKDIDKQAKEWFLTSKYELYKAIREQVLPSGVFYEKSVGYHRLVTEFFFYSCILLQKNGEIIPQDIWYRIRSMVYFTLHYQSNTGLAPVIGDQDDARLLPFSIQQNTDHRYLLTLGAIFFKDSYLKQHASSEGMSDAFFLIGKEARNIYDNLRTDNMPLVSKAFEDAGFYIMRNERFYVFINHSGQSFYQDDPFVGGAHTHADMLSFELHIDNQPIIVDTGSYLYTSNRTERNYHRSTRMHNTIEIDNENQYVVNPNHLFAYATRVEPELLHWQSNSSTDCFEGQHDAYMRLTNGGILHKRKVCFDKLRHTVEITDTLVGSGNHNVALRFHLAPALAKEISCINKEVKGNISNKDNLNITFESAEDIMVDTEDSWVSSQFGKRVASSAIVVKANPKVFPFKVVTKISTESLNIE